MLEIVVSTNPNSWGDLVPSHMTNTREDGSMDSFFTTCDTKLKWQIVMAMIELNRLRSETTSCWKQYNNSSTTQVSGLHAKMNKLNIL